MAGSKLSSEETPMKKFLYHLVFALTVTYAFSFHAEGESAPVTTAKEKDGSRRRLAGEIGAISVLKDVAWEGKIQQLTSHDQAPVGLSKSDWSSIRAAYEAERHHVS